LKRRKKYYLLFYHAMQSSGAGGDVDRALSSIRARADHLRHTVARLEHNLAWNPASTW
jgi:mediator of RNA polymerase II transcription subunit 8